MARRVRVLGEQEHSLLLRACRDVVAVLIAEVVGAEVEVEVEAQERELWAVELHAQLEEDREMERQLEAALAAQAAFWVVVEEEERWQR